jgi:hypothetical protein
MLVALVVLFLLVLVVQHRSKRGAGKERPVTQHDVLVLPPHLAEALRMPPTLIRPNVRAPSGSAPASGPSGPPSPPR